MWKTINYMGAEIDVSTEGVILWNDTIRKHHFNYDGYPVVSVKTEKGWRNIGVARLIATAFIPNPHNLPEVDHLDFNRKNFSIDNLRWISHEENVRRSVCNKPDISGRNNPNFGNHKLGQFYKEHPDIAKEKQSRPGKQNGRYVHGRYVSEKV